MAAILRWFHDGETRYRVYYRQSESSPNGRELIIASAHGEAADVVDGNRRLEDFTSAELIAYARRLRAEHAQSVRNGTASDSVASSD